MPRARVTALLGRASSGVSIRPFICEDDRERILYVKPYGSLVSSLISEWLAARLAVEMELPVPIYDVVEVPDGLGAAAGESELRPGPAFASESLGPGAADLLPRDLGRIRPALLAEALAFDAWIHNGDRILGSMGGNPNAMLVSPGSRFYLIDHDNGFDPDFDSHVLIGMHPGRAQAGHWLDAARRDQWTERARKAFDKFGGFWQELPPEWVEEDGEPKAGVDKFRTRALDILRRPFDRPAEFWNSLDPIKR